MKANQTRKLSNLILEDCVISDPLALNAFARMKTDVCKLETQRLVCNNNQKIVDDLPNKCPFYGNFFVVIFCSSNILFINYQ